MINGVEFGVWSAEEIRKISVVQITESSKTVLKGKPIENGLRDERMGPLHVWSKCKTCNLNKRKCPGHFGHIELINPVYHISWVTSVICWLKMTCITCGNLLLRDETKPDVCRSKHLNFYSKNVYSKCPTCETKQPKYSWSRKSGTILVNKKKYKINDVIDHIEKLDDSVPERLNMSHPRDMILTCIPVPPPLVRPPIMNGKSVRGEDDITYRLIQIMRQNNKMKKILNSNRPQHVIDNIQEHLQMSVTGYINHHKLPNVTVRSSKREYTSLQARLKTKEGRIRGNLMGKRCDFTGRSVITGDDCLGMDEVGIPESMAKTLTVPVKVTGYNKKLLEDMMKTDDVRFVVRPNGSRIDMSYVKKQGINIDVGWTIERILKDGDIVLFNRQPSLHKMSIMAHVARVMPYSTLRMNLSCTPPYNADFDGDEMNIHVPQTPEAQSEARNIMAVQYQIVSPQSNRPVMSIIQDSLIGAYLLTDDNVILDKNTFFSCLVEMPGWDGKAECKESYTGKELISMCLPMVNWSNKSIKICKGRLVSGQLNKSCLGTSQGSLIHVIFNDCGPSETILFINRLQRIVHKWLCLNGFSVGISDMMSSLKFEIQDEVKNAFEDVKDMKDEGQINARLNVCRDTLGNMVQKPLNNSNRLYCMVSGARSKGSNINISQIMGVVGQQNLCGKRIPNTWTDRTLPHFKRGSNQPHEKGFIQHSYIEGLSPHELWFHAIAGREGIIDTACKTSVTGYLQRKFMKALESLVVQWDGSVRNADGSILQFQYGDDGYDGCSIEKQTIETYDKVIVGTNEEKEQLLMDYHFLMEHNRWKDPSIIDSNQYMLPIPVKRIIDNARTLFSFPSSVINDASFIYKKVVELVNTIPNEMIKILIRSHLNSYKLMKMKITRDEFNKIIHDIKNCRVNCAAGESVGAIAAQSLGEPATQMTLNTFHFAGVASKNVTLGIPRLNEIINCIVNIETPMVTIESRTLEKTYEQVKFYSLQKLVDRYSIVDNPNKKEIEDFLLFPDEGYVYDSTKKTLVLYLNEFYDVIAIKKILHDCICAYTDGPKPIFHIQAKEDINIGLLYEKDLKKRCIKGLEGADETDIKDGKIHTSLRDISKLFNLENIVYNSISSNNVHQVVKTYGIEAGRSTIMLEIRSILGFYGIYVNIRHILIVIDWMTFIGKLTPLTRHGIRNVDQSPLKRSTFEEVVEVINQAAVCNESDDLHGVSECIVMGRPPNVGTRMIELEEDRDMVEKYAQPMPIDSWKLDDKKFEWEDDEDDIYGGVSNVHNDGEWDTTPIFVPDLHKKKAPMLQPPMLQPPMLQPFRPMPVRPQSFVPQPFVPQPQFSLPIQTPNYSQPIFGQKQSVQPMFGSIQKRKRPESPPSPAYSPVSPDYGPQSYNPNSPVSPAYEPKTPEYDPGSPVSPAYSPVSPAYSPVSPAYSPTSPAYNPNDSNTPNFSPRQNQLKTSELDAFSLGEPMIPVEVRSKKTFF